MPLPTASAAGAIFVMGSWLCWSPSSSMSGSPSVCICSCRRASWPAGSSGSDREDAAMQTLNALLQGFATALTLANLGWALLGVTLGTATGILPGIGPALTIALLLPLTSHLDPTAAFIMFAGLYYGAMYGSSTTSILLNTPGESGSIITAIEGNLMARQGRGAAALATAAIGSFIAGTIGTMLLTFVAPFVVKIAIKFSPAAYFSLMILAFTTVSAMLGASLLRGLIALFVGIGIGLVGTDKLTGQGRLPLGFLELLGGLAVVGVSVRPC